MQVPKPALAPSFFNTLNDMKLLYYSDFFKIKAKSELSLLLNKSKYSSLFAPYAYAFEQKTGIEIGGPTKIFASGLLPIYQWAKQIDGVNFSSNTIWEGTIKNNEYKYFQNKTGRQYILDGTDLHEIEDEKYDFLLSSHNLEHIANPLRAIKEWARVLKPGGFMLLILPDKNFTFDRKRSYTKFEHVLSDLEAGTGEDDLTHLDEILKFHDFKLDPRAGSDFNAFKKRGENNLTDRALHHHVYSQDLLKKMLDHYQFTTLAQHFIPPYNQIILGQKPLTTKPANTQEEKSEQQTG